MHILRGELKAGEHLPSSRELASDLHVSRIVIIEAYGQLLAEGYIESRRDQAHMSLKVPILKKPVKNARHILMN